MLDGSSVKTKVASFLSSTGLICELIKHLILSGRLSETDLRNQKEYMLFKERRNPLSSLIWKVRTVNKQYNKLEGDFKAERDVNIREKEQESLSVIMDNILCCKLNCICLRQNKTGPND